MEVLRFARCFRKSGTTKTALIPSELQNRPSIGHEPRRRVVYAADLSGSREVCQQFDVPYVWRPGEEMDRGLPDLRPFGRGPSIVRIGRPGDGGQGRRQGGDRWI